MQLDKVCSIPAVIARDDEPLADAAARMRFSDLGSAAVVDESRMLIGVITERDIVRAVADGASIETTLVGDYMTPDAPVATPETGAREAARLMLEKGIRHLPVVTANRHVVGFASVQDLLFELLWTA